MNRYQDFKVVSQISRQICFSIASGLVVLFVKSFQSHLSHSFQMSPYQVDIFFRFSYITLPPTHSFYTNLVMSALFFQSPAVLKSFFELAHSHLLPPYSGDLISFKSVLTLQSCFVIELNQNRSL